MYSRFKILFICLVIFMGLAVFSINAAETSRISLDLRNIEVTDALKFLATKGSLNIIPTKQVTGRITLMIEDALVKDVFDIILRSNNLAYEKQGNIYNVMTENEYNARYGKNFFDIRQTKIFRLQYAVPRQVYNLAETLKSSIGKILIDEDSGTLLVMDTPEKLVEITQILKAMDRKGVIRMFSLKYARAAEVEKQLRNQLDIKKVGSIRADARTNQVIVQTLPERMNDIQRLIEGLDQKTKAVLIDAKIIQVKLSNALSSGIEWEGLFDLGKDSGVSYLGSYPYSWVGDSTTDPWKSRSETFADVGYVGSYPFSGSTLEHSSGTSKAFGDQMHLGVIGQHDFDTTINYLRTLGETKVLSNPKLSVINNEEAKIHVGERRAYITTTTTQSQASTTVSEEVTYIDVGIQLFVTPTINDEGFITVKVKPEITSVVDYLETSQENKIPIVEVATAETIVMVKSGTSILIGGLSKEEKTLNSGETPILSKLPFLGELFKSGGSGSVRTELLVMLTPYLISGDELTTGYTRDFGHALDKDYQDYKPFVDEVIQIEAKTYQGYPALEVMERPLPQLKPKKNF